MAKLISDEDKKYLITLQHYDLTVSNITKLFSWTAKKVDGKLVRVAPRYNTMDLVHLDANEYINIEAVDTTVGIILWNKLFAENTIHHILPNHFLNEVVDGKVYEKVTKYVSDALMAGKLAIEPNLIQFLDNFEFYSMKLVTLFSPSYTQGLFQTPPAIKKKKKDLTKDLDSSKKTLEELVAIEDELVDFAKKELDKDSGMTLFKSKARGNFENDYKNMNLMVGPVKNESNGEYDFIPHSYLDGLEKEDWVAAGNIIVNATYPKAVGTEVGGYLTKQFYAVYQSIITDPDLEDCGTKQFLRFKLTEDLYGDFEYQYIRLKDGEPWELLNPDTKKKYIGHNVQLRSPMFCGSDKLCHKCIGDLPKKLNIKNIGLTTGRISNTLLAKKMKLFHNAKVKFDRINIDELLL